MSTARLLIHRSAVSAVPTLTIRDAVPMLPRSHPARVTTAGALRTDGVSRRQLAGELAIGRWRRAGLAIVLHNGPLSRPQQLAVARVHGGPHAKFTAFTAAEILGLQGWDREEVHLLAPAGTRVRAGSPVPVRVHLHGASPIYLVPGRAVEALPHAVLRAAATFTSPRPGSGLLAAAVQQRLLSAADLSAALTAQPRTRHRAMLRAAVADIDGGSEALSEIDFVRLCRRSRLPQPVRQAVRREASGRRRYLDATWKRSDGRLVVVEIDGALHLAPRRWWDDQLRQNELALADAMVLRYPSIVVRTEPALIVAQLRRALRLDRW